ncbi:hypothetical protein ARMA_1330 [Ardenticatena maritima]|uniref:Uncharacterized protein n=1 Tax=Ardenticatena maritima TaxID=872965 RepID=A0A0M9UCJ0_9CHLR|nr:hypothetical protein ARMA_1330 [Ardenticatena maritima]
MPYDTLHVCKKMPHICGAGSLYENTPSRQNVFLPLLLKVYIFR